MTIGLEGFEGALKDAALELKSINRSETIKLVSNLDADGITAASIIVKVLERENFSYNLAILHQLKENFARDLASEDYGTFIFCDLGSGQLKSINKHFRGKKVFVLDHHEIQGEPAQNVTHINPHSFGFDGSSEVSAAGVCFFFARSMGEDNEDLAHLAVIGAIGDVQEKNGFKGLNRVILEIAEKKGKIKVERGLKLFGLETRPLIKLLLYSSDLEIPGVSNDEAGVIVFLKEIGVNPLEPRNRWKSYYDLSEKQRKDLASKIILKRKEASIPYAEDVFTNVYKLPGEKRGQFRDAKEFSTLLNSCGRMDNAGLGIGACLGDEKQKRKALKGLLEYKRTLIDAMSWYKANKGDPSRVTKGKNYIIINARSEVLATVVGTIASMITKNGDAGRDTFVLSMARNIDDTTKVSLRVSNNPAGVDLKAIVSEVTSVVGGEAGGHQYAAGAIIATEREDAFIEVAKEVFNRHTEHNKKKN
ncbi:DHH family phosphoesterase [Candidatus Woesearchaeota archaeon]|nr:DHH family phosphoesterase [Candidatus Woesearchaeota archaeon]